MTDALKELNIRGDEFAKTGKGSAEEAFQRLGYTATDVAQKLKDPNRFLDEIIGKLQKMDAAVQTRILDEVFGGTGAEQMAKVLGLSVTEIQNMRNEATTFTAEQSQKAVGNARTMGEVMNATDLANRAKSIARFGKHDNILDLVAAVESGGDYNSTLDNGRWTGGAQNLVGMTLDQVRALQKKMLADPANRALYGDGKGSSALGRYQITGATLDGLIKELGLSGDRLFDEKTQDELGRALLRRRGSDPAALRQEWTGLKQVDDGTIRNAYAGTPTAAQPLAPTDSVEALDKRVKAIIRNDRVGMIILQLCDGDHPAKLRVTRALGFLLRLIDGKLKPLLLRGHTGNRLFEPGKIKTFLHGLVLCACRSRQDRA